MRDTSMLKIDKLLTIARRRAAYAPDRELARAIARMTTEQLRELDAGATDERFREIFESVGALNLILDGGE